MNIIKVLGANNIVDVGQDTTNIPEKYIVIQNEKNVMILPIVWDLYIYSLFSYISITDKHKEVIDNDVMNIYRPLT